MKFMKSEKSLCFSWGHFPCPVEQIYSAAADHRGHCVGCAGALCFNTLRSWLPLVQGWLQRIKPTTVDHGGFLLTFFLFSFSFVYLYLRSVSFWRFVMSIWHDDNRSMEGRVSMSTTSCWTRLRFEHLNNGFWQNCWTVKPTRRLYTVNALKWFSQPYLDIANDFWFLFAGHGAKAFWYNPSRQDAL